MNKGKINSLFPQAKREKYKLYLVPSEQKREIILLFPHPSIANYTLLTALLNRGAANNTCYHPANCQQREIIILSPAH